ncbi:hypothetical protein BHE74_00021283 [Ensete ventricosum]|nr:hypothetical protein BHE74_00021283 [Ensete ventricosum]
MSLQHRCSRLGCNKITGVGITNLSNRLIRDGGYDLEVDGSSGNKRIRGGDCDLEIDGSSGREEIGKGECSSSKQQGSSDIVGASGEEGGSNSDGGKKKDSNTGISTTATGDIWVARASSNGSVRQQVLEQAATVGVAAEEGTVGSDESQMGSRGDRNRLRAVAAVEEGAATLAIEEEEGSDGRGGRGNKQRLKSVQKATTTSR